MVHYHEMRTAVVKENDKIVIMFGNNSLQLTIGQAKVLCMKIFDLVVKG